MPDGFWLISAGVVGAILGSFFNVVIAELPPEFRFPVEGV